MREYKKTRSLLLFVNLVPCAEVLTLSENQLHESSWQALGVIHPKTGFFSLIFYLLWTRICGRKRSDPMAYVWTFLVFSFLCLWGEGGEMADFYDFSLKSICASLYWLWMHEYLCNTSTVSLYIHTVHMTQARTSLGLHPTASSPS
jgi:hypothetical protein